LQYKIPSTNLKHCATYILNISEAVGSCTKSWKTCPTYNDWRQV